MKADLSLTPLSCGFDPRVHGMACVVPAGATVEYECSGDIRVTRSVAELRRAGYTVVVRATEEEQNA